MDSSPVQTQAVLPSSVNELFVTAAQAEVKTPQLFDKLVQPLRHFQTRICLAMQIMPALTLDLRGIAAQNFIGDWTDSLGHAIRVFCADNTDVLQVHLSKPFVPDKMLSLRLCPSGWWRCGNAALQPLASSPHQLCWLTADWRCSVWQKKPLGSETPSSFEMVQALDYGTGGSDFGSIDGLSAWAMDSSIPDSDSGPSDMLDAWTLV
eukprot:TRINITY_DN48217_c0_g1_i1.p1 TRINITY_DN48217_c0_g1~~TRINITY_DN48217_c0_g1_i1.p1  ORF type:complete len:207 (+),score=39.94 TRINITY_DN48217_c0_g1_i1:85-705(+)